MAIRVLLADDHRLVRDGLRALLHSQEDLEVIAEAEEGRAAVKLAAELEPDAVVMDISMPDLNGVEATRQIKSHCHHTAVIILSAHSDEKIGVDAMKAGAMGLVPKDAAFEELAAAIRTAIQGKVYLSPQLRWNSAQIAAHAAAASGNDPFDVLTPREREVMQLVSEGRATKEIARKLDLSVKTIETYRRQIMAKLGLVSVAELTKYALREGLTAL